MVFFFFDKLQTKVNFLSIGKMSFAIRLLFNPLLVEITDLKKLDWGWGAGKAVLYTTQRNIQES